MLKKVTRLFIRSDKLFTLPLTFSLAGALFICGFLLFLFDQLPTHLPLLYSLSWGEAQMVSKTQFFLLPAVVVLIGLFNALIAWHIHQSQVVLKRILLLSLIFITLIAVITTIKILTIFI